MWDFLKSISSRSQLRLCAEFLTQTHISTGVWASVFSRNILFMAWHLLSDTSHSGFVSIRLQRQETSSRDFLSTKESLSSSIWCKVMLRFLISARIKTSDEVTGSVWWKPRLFKIHSGSFVYFKSVWLHFTLNHHSSFCN